MPCGHILECADELPPTVREGRYKKGELLMSKKKLGIGIAAVAAAGAGAAALTVKNHNKAKVQKEKAAAEHAEYRNTERGKHEKNSKGIYYTNGNYEHLPDRESRRVWMTRTHI